MKTKRIAKVLAPLFIVGMLSMPVMAATPIGGNGKANTDDTVLTIPKAINVVNDDYTKSYSPNVTYTFSIAPSTNVGRVTDNTGASVMVTAGVDGGITRSANVNFTSELVEESTANATSLSEQVIEDLVLTVDLSKFSEPGIYRYIITDTTALADLYAAGIVRSADFDTTRELDVYIIRDEQAGTLGISGYVLLDEIPPVVVDGTAKTPGYVIDGDIKADVHPGTDGVPGTEDDEYAYSLADPDNSVDRYYTYNLELTKNVTGNMANRTHEFSFTVGIAGSNAVFAGEDVAQLTAVSPDASGVVTATAGLAHGETLYVYGLSPRATYQITEENNTVNSYKVTVPVANVADQVVAPNSQVTLDPVNISNYATANSATDIHVVPAGNGDAEFTNNLSSPSTTGFLMRIAPYIALVALAGAGLIVFKKFKIKGESDK